MKRSERITNARGGARLFGNALSKVLKQSTPNRKVEIAAVEKQVEDIKSTVGQEENSFVASVSPIPRLNEEDEYSLPLTSDVLHRRLSDLNLDDTDYSLPVFSAHSPDPYQGFVSPAYSLPVYPVPLLYASSLIGLESVCNDITNYDLPVCSSPGFESICNDTTNYDLPLCSSPGFLSSSSSDLSDEGFFETKKSFETDSPSDEKLDSGTCLTCEADEKFHRSQENKQESSDLPRYDACRIITVKFDSTFVDSHCHLDFLFQRENHYGTLSAYRQKHELTFPVSFEGCVAVFCNPSTFIAKTMWQRILSEGNVWAAFGCHPHNSDKYCDAHENALITALEHPQVRALGEIGLDYSGRNNCCKDVQQKVLRRQLKIALNKKLPLVIHCREAHDDTLEIMKEMVPRDYKIHLHCFTDTWKYATEWLDAFPNLCIGITNVVTFGSAKRVHNVAKNIPLDRLLLETDAPYFVPRATPRSTKRAHPGMAIHVAAQIAVLRGDKLDEVLHWTRKNTHKVYGV